MKKVLFFILCLVGCTTVPRIEVDHEASWDGDEQNSGIIEEVPGEGFRVTPHFKKRYEVIMELYKDRFPVDNPDEGIKPDGKGGFIINAQHMVYFLDGNILLKNGIEP